VGCGNNRPSFIVTNKEFINLITAGRPHFSIPSHTTINRDIDLVFQASCDCIKKLLIAHSGHLHFAMDAWTSTNHHAFIVWTVHLQHNDEMLSFLLDIVEVLQSHTGKTLAKVFQKMVTDFGIEHKILSMAADNASANDIQTTALATDDNSFNKEAHICCFNHTMQLSVRALLSPFQISVGQTGDKPSEDDAEDLNVEVDKEEEEEDEDEGNDPKVDDGEEDVDNGHDELAELPKDAQQHQENDMTFFCHFLSTFSHLLHLWKIDIAY